MATLSVRVDDDVKLEADSIFESLGLNTSVAINMFLRKCIQCDGIPFTLTREPNAETISAIREVQAMKRDPASGKSYADAEEMFADLLR